MRQETSVYLQKLTDPSMQHENGFELCTIRNSRHWVDGESSLRSKVEMVVFDGLLRVSDIVVTRHRIITAPRRSCNPFDVVVREKHQNFLLAEILEIEGADARHGGRLDGGKMITQ
jgi:hypothetical protein